MVNFGVSSARHPWHGNSNAMPKPIASLLLTLALVASSRAADDYTLGPDSQPKPGVPPSAGYLAGLVSRLAATPPRAILRNAYNDAKAAEWLAARVRAPVVTLPFSVGGTPAAKDLFGLVDDTLERLVAVAANGEQR